MINSLYKFITCLQQCAVDIYHPCITQFATCISMCQRHNHLRSVRSVPHKPICVRRGADQKLDLGRCVTMDFTTSNWESIVKESPKIYVIFIHLLMSFLSPRLFMSWTTHSTESTDHRQHIIYFLEMKTIINDTIKIQ